jgi:hypothetical protein
MILTTAVSPQASAQCDQRLRECATLVELGNAVIKQQQSIIMIQDDQISAMKFSIDSLEDEIEEKSKWYRDPFVLIPLSLLAGVVIGVQVGK